MNITELLRKHNISTKSDLSDAFIAKTVWAVYEELGNERTAHWLATKEFLPDPVYDLAKVFGKDVQWFDEYLTEAMELALPGFAEQLDAEHEQWVAENPEAYAELIAMLDEDAPNAEAYFQRKREEREILARMEEELGK